MLRLIYTIYETFYWACLDPRDLVAFTAHAVLFKNLDTPFVSTATLVLIMIARKSFLSFVIFTMSLKCMGLFIFVGSVILFAVLESVMTPVSISMVTTSYIVYMSVKRLVWRVDQYGLPRRTDVRDIGCSRSLMAMLERGEHLRIRHVPGRRMELLEVFRFIDTVPLVYRTQLHWYPSSSIGDVNQLLSILDRYDNNVIARLYAKGMLPRNLVCQSRGWPKFQMPWQLRMRYYPLEVQRRILCTLCILRRIGQPLYWKRRGGLMDAGTMVIEHILKGTPFDRESTHFTCCRGGPNHR